MCVWEGDVALGGGEEGRRSPTLLPITVSPSPSPDPARAQPTPTQVHPNNSYYSVDLPGAHLIAMSTYVSLAVLAGERAFRAGIPCHSCSG